MGFLNAIFLFGLIAGAIPIIIHLLNRRRVRKLKFSSLEFLDEVTRRRMRKINLRRILILILRTLAVLLLVFVFARPTLRNTAFFLPGKAAKNVVICLDVSYSMALNNEQGTAFTVAQDIAREVVAQSEKDDVLNVVLFASRAESVLEKGTRNRALILNAIDRATPGAESTSIRRAVQRAVELIDVADIDGGEIYVVSDFRYNADSSLVSPELKRDDVRLYFLPVYEDSPDNVSIDRVMVPRKLLRPGEVVRVSAAVTNHSATSPASFPLELSVDESRKAEKVVNLAPSASATITFPISFTDWGVYQCRLSKNRDRLPLDDDRYFLLEVSHSVPVTLVRGKRRLGVGDKGATAGFFFLEKALNPRGTAESEFIVKTIDERNLTASALPTRGVVIWVDPQRIEEKRLTLLERYVRRGGGLIVFLGGSDRRLYQDREFCAFIGMRGAAETESSPQTGYTSFEKDHPVFSIFSPEELELLTRTSVSSYVSARGVASDSVLAFTGGGDPALWECVRGRGRVLVFAAGPNLESGDIPLSPMFLPLVHTSVSYLASAGIAQRSPDNIVGAPLFFDTPQLSRNAAGQMLIRDPAGDPIKPVVFETPQGDVQVICERPRTVGVYTLYQDTTRIAEAAVNLDARESNLAVSSLTDDTRNEASVVSIGGDFARNLQAERQGREIFALFVFLAAAALVAESVLGRRA